MGRFLIRDGSKGLEKEKEKAKKAKKRSRRKEESKDKGQDQGKGKGGEMRRVDSQPYSYKPQT